MNWNGKTVLVTGADGFIGSHLVERLVSEGARVRAFCFYDSNGSLGWLFSALFAALGRTPPSRLDRLTTAPNRTSTKTNANPVNPIRTRCTLPFPSSALQPA